MKDNMIYVFMKLSEFVMVTSWLTWLVNCTCLAPFLFFIEDSMYLVYCGGNQLYYGTNLILCANRLVTAMEKLLNCWSSG